MTGTKMFLNDPDASLVRLSTSFGQCFDVGRWLVRESIVYVHYLVTASRMWPSSLSF